MAFVKKFYISDHHFSHANIISFSDRPFRSPGVMDEQMIRAWNSVVGTDDIIYHLGDFALGLGDVERVTWNFERLNGRKFLVLGNHDLDNKSHVHKTLAGLGWAAPPTHATEVHDGGSRVYLHHYACRVWPGHHRGSYHFYGHSHGALPGIGRSRDVGVDMPDVAFIPRTFAELTSNMNSESENGNP
jgi:calcineurin-like phosphoesterase family protein